MIAGKRVRQPHRSVIEERSESLLLEGRHADLLRAHVKGQKRVTSDQEVGVQLREVAAAPDGPHVQDQAPSQPTGSRLEPAWLPSDV